MSREGPEQPPPAAAPASSGSTTRLILYHPDDRGNLTDLSCLVRHQLEVFVVNPGSTGGGSDVFSDGGGEDDDGDIGSSAFAEGRVGIRCIHCAAPEPLRHRARNAACYPKALRLMYQSARNWQRHHLLACPDVPPEVKAEFESLSAAGGGGKGGQPKRRSKSRKGMDVQSYWERMSVRMGLVDGDGDGDAAGGLRLRRAALDGTWTDDMGWEATTQHVCAASSAGAKQAAKTGKTGLKSLKPDYKRHNLKSDKEIFDGVFDNHDQDRKEGAEGGNDQSVSSKMPTQNDGAAVIGEATIARRRRRWPVLYLPEDREQLTELACLVRRQIEVYALPRERPGDPTSAVTYGSSASDNLHRAGMRCVHCARSDSEHSGREHGRVPPPQARGAAFRPTSIRLVYQAVRNWQSNHFASCRAVPQAVRDEYDALRVGKVLNGGGEKAQQQRRSGSVASYWEQTCGKLGLVDTDDGLCLMGAVAESVEATTMGQSSDEELQSQPCSGIHVDVYSLLNGVDFGEPDQDTIGIDPIPLRDASLCSRFGRVESRHIRGMAHPSSHCSPALNFDSSASVPRHGNLSGNHPPTAASRRRDSTDVSPSGVVSNDDLLTRMQLAIAAVRAVGEIRTFSPTLPSETNQGQHRGDDADAISGDSSSLVMVGRELYTLFAGQQPYDGESEVSSEVGQRDHKRGTRPGEQRRYVPLRELGLPITLCSLVSRLLDSEAADATRYRSVAEVEDDLCLMAAQSEKFLFSEPAAEFRISENVLYGREEEASNILKAYEQATDITAEGNSLVLVSGFAGAGKSSLVRALHGRFLERGARFISGGFDATSQIASFSTLAAALDEYCSIVAQDVNQISQVREVITAAVGSEGGVLASMMPNIRKVMNVTADVSFTPVTGRQAMQRLMFLFLTLLRATCSRLTPVVIFLDDLQWADEVSLEVINALVTDSELRGLLFIGCYRENEVGSDHPLTNHLISIHCSRSTSVTAISVGNLGKGAANEIVSDTLRMLPRMTLPLSEAVMNKTSGNALFMMQFLSAICDDGLLRFSLATRQWEWDIDRIRSKDIANNVVELMTAKIHQLAPEVREVLQLAACFGARCYEQVLCIFDRASGSVASTAVALELAVSEGLLVKCESGYRFSHDLIHCAAYALIPQSKREPFHLRIGRLLWQGASTEELKAHLFVVVDQLNKAVKIVTDCDERFRLAQLNLTAGKRSSSMSAFLPASLYFKTGIKLLADNDWERRRETCLDLHNSAAEMLYILGHYDDLKLHIGQVLQRPLPLQDKLRAYFVLVQSTGAQENTSDAISTCLTILDQLGETLPSTVSRDVVQQEMAKTQALLASKMQGAGFNNLGTMQNVDKKEAMKFLKLTMTYDFSEKSIYMPLLACRMVQLSLLYGLCRESATGFASFGSIVGAVTGNHTAANRLGKFALSVLDYFNAKESLPKVFSVVYGHIMPWSGEPLSSILPFHKHAIDVGMSIGNIEIAMYNAHMYSQTALHSGYPLAELMDEMTAYSKQMMASNRNNMALLNFLGASRRQFATNLLGRSANRAILAGEELDDENADILERHRGEKFHDSLGLFVYYFRSWLACLFHNYEVAAEMAMNYRKLMKGTDHYRFASLANHTFIYGLAVCALAKKDRGSGKWHEKIEVLSAAMEQLARTVPWNCHHKFQLLRAEKASLDGNHTEAARLYESAVDLAAEHRFVQDQALALERAGMFYLESGDDATASGLFEKSYACYMQWGAVSKAAHIKECYLFT